MHGVPSSALSVLRGGGSARPSMTSPAAYVGAVVAGAARHRGECIAGSNPDEPQQEHCSLLCLSITPAGKLRVTGSDIRRGGQVQLLLKATGRARMTIDGNVIADLSITGWFLA